MLVIVSLITTKFDNFLETVWEYCYALCCKILSLQNSTFKNTNLARCGPYAVTLMKQTPSDTKFYFRKENPL